MSVYMRSPMSHPSLTEDELNDALDFSIRAATTAASIINCAIEERTNASLQDQWKATTADPVTHCERQCRDEVVNILRSCVPSYPICTGDPHSKAVLGDGPTWMVSPIDGITSFAHGLFDCSVSIALVVNREPVLGVVCAPRLHEMFTAVKNRGAFSNGQRIHVSPVTSLQRSVVLLRQTPNGGDAAVKSMMAMQAELAKLPVQGLRCHGSAALDMCFVAAGRAELFWEVGVQPWNVAAGTIIVREAGGVVHDVDGTDTLDFTRHSVCCGCSLDITQHGVELSRKHNYRSCV